MTIYAVLRDWLKNTGNGNRDVDLWGGPVDANASGRHARSLAAGKKTGLKLRNVSGHVR